MEECGQAQDQIGSRLGRDGNGVRQHVLVLMDRILLESERRQFGDDLLGFARIDQGPKRVQAIVVEQRCAQAISGNCGFHRLTVCWKQERFAPHFLS